MAGPAAILREIHRLRNHAQNLQSRIDLAPKQLKAQQNLVANREEELKQGHDGVKKFKVGIHEREVSIKAENQLIAKYQKQLNDISSKKEYDALKHEIAGVEVKIKALEEEMLGAMMELDEKTAKLPALEEAVKKAKAEFAAFERDYQTRLDTWSKERGGVDKLVADEEAKLPPEALAQYIRLVKAMGADALAAVEGKTCTACYTEMTTQYHHNVMLQQFVLCRNCGRVLYQKDER
jgi:uncharacterized protein